MRQANAWRMRCSRVVGRLVSHAGDGLRPALGVSRILNCTLTLMRICMGANDASLFAACCLRRDAGFERHHDCFSRRHAASSAGRIRAPVPQQFSWSGFYIGGNPGYGWTGASGTITTTIGTGSFSSSGNGFLGSAQAGYDWQAESIVFGVEADFQGTRASGSVNAVAGPTINGTINTPWFGTVRGQIGYAADRVLLYATGGGVYGDSSLSGNVSTVGPFSNSTTFWSWTAGGGVEWAFYGCWSAKLEYLYVGSPSKFPSVPTVTENNNSNTNVVRAGINYHF
jgi:outer membrane immunogenic protein